MQAIGPSIATIAFDPERTSKLRREELDHLAYHIGRLLTGERTAESEWTHFGLAIELTPVESR